MPRTVFAPVARLLAGGRIFAILAYVLAMALVAALVFLVVRTPGDQDSQALATTMALPRIDLKPGPANAVLTARGDLSRLGFDDQEPALSQAAVSSGRFGKRIALQLDGKVYAQPLFLPGLRIDGGIHDVVIVATEHDSVYAFDAHSTGHAAPLWRVSLLMPGARPLQAATDQVGYKRYCDSIVPQVGITSTPVVDWSTKTLYVMALDVENGTMTYRLHALDIYTGKDKMPSVVVSGAVSGTGFGSVNGTVSFAGADEQQRMALTEVKGIVYAGFGSFCGDMPYHGWVMGFSAATLARAIVYCDTPDGWGGGLWESAAGITADAHGHLFLVSGNGSFDLSTGGPDAGDTIMEMLPQDGTLKLVDYFTPFTQRCLAEHDLDLGAGSPLDVPGKDEFILTGKTGNVYVLNRASLGGYHAMPGTRCGLGPESQISLDTVKQELPANTVPGGMWGTWAYWSQGPDQYVYACGAAGPLIQWRLRPDGTIDPVPLAQAGYGCGIPVTSGDAGRPGSGIVWVIDHTQGAVLRAFAANDVRVQLWSSDKDPARDAMLPGEYDHFTAPVTADGLVIVADQDLLDIYGMLQV
jgi:hypothetical protein